MTCLRSSKIPLIPSKTKYPLGKRPKNLMPKKTPLGTGSEPNHQHILVHTIAPSSTVMVIILMHYNAWCTIIGWLVRRRSRLGGSCKASKLSIMRSAICFVWVNDQTRAVRSRRIAFSFVPVVRGWFYFSSSEKNWTCSNFTSSACWVLSGLEKSFSILYWEQEADSARRPATCVFSYFMLRLLAC